MSTIIKVENLGKSYIIGHQREKYVALRDVLANKARQTVGNAKKFFTGGQLIAGNEMEEFWALKDINFEVQQGDRLGIIGRNGAGKSTLLKVLSRITEPTTGRIQLKGRVASLLEVGTGFHPELSGRENIYLNGAILGMGRAEVRKKFDEIVDFAGVEKFLDTPVKRYSSGMYVRLAFAVAAHLEPEILIIDEVLAVGDAEFQKKCLGKMEDVSKNDGRTVIFVSHNMAAIQILCNKAIVLKNGNIEYPIGEVNQAVRRYMNTVQEISIINLKDRKDRHGEGNIKITNFEFLNQYDQAQETLLTGQFVKMKIDYESIGNNTFTNVAVAVAIYGDDNVLYTVVGNEFSSKPFEEINSSGSFICELDKFPIVSGRYTLNLIVSQNGVMEDWIQEAVLFDVEGGDFYGTGKIVPATHRSVLINNKWSFIS